ncbi:hypothetical protein AVEN_134974-1 [Araneus ventricosus]|uniref:Uncharacterized protein n=1 Tax=Araneus ventricosus TaxID=182803 RepID=A0A4Y2CH68_ARAVE|nr:hypothetical protein AVEN_134974-1 [Araneus ventricosus]
MGCPPPCLLGKSPRRGKQRIRMRRNVQQMPEHPLPMHTSPDSVGYSLLFPFIYDTASLENQYPGKTNRYCHLAEKAPNTTVCLTTLPK